MKGTRRDADRKTSHQRDLGIQLVMWAEGLGDLAISLIKKKSNPLDIVYCATEDVSEY